LRGLSQEKLVWLRSVAIGPVGTATPKRKGLLKRALRGRVENNLGLLLRVSGGKKRCNETQGGFGEAEIGEEG